MLCELLMPSACYKTSFISAWAEVISVDTIQETPAPGQLWEYRAPCDSSRRSHSLNPLVSVLKRTRRGQLCSSSSAIGPRSESKHIVEAMYAAEIQCLVLTGFVCSREKETRHTSQKLLINLTNQTKTPHSLSVIPGIERKLNCYSSGQVLASHL